MDILYFACAASPLRTSVLISNYIFLGSYTLDFTGFTKVNLIAFLGYKLTHYLISNHSASNLSHEYNVRYQVYHSLLETDLCSLNAIDSRCLQKFASHSVDI